jgi:uncharacterized protein YodC (DUF2158 family)
MEMGMKTGDLVVLKSGGPVMTVGSVKGKDVKCLWFAEGHEMEARSGSFQEETLEAPKKAK